MLHWILRFTRLTIVILVYGSLLSINSCKREVKPNVLFIAVDDLNDWIGCLDNHPGAQTPNLDRLAGNGTLFTNAHCASPACNPSRVSLITGVSPTTSGVYHNRDDWRQFESLEGVVTLPEHFRKNGYRTAGSGKIYHAHSLNQEAFMGFLDPEPWDEWFPSKELQMPYEVQPDSMPVNGNSKFYNGYFDWSPLDIDDEEMADAKVVSWAERQLGRKHDKPLFLAVGIYRPHVPWYTPQVWYDQHPLEEVVLPETLENDLEDIPQAGQDLARQHWQKWLVENSKWQGAVQAYLASMSFADAMIGRLIEALEDGPLASNTIVVLWSDHGYHLGQKEHWEKFALWEQTTRVPLIFRDYRTERRSSFRQGAVCSQPASLLDIYPTLAELCGLEIPGHSEGNSLVPYLEDPGMEPVQPVVITHKPGMHAVRSEQWRYITYPDGSEELYELDKDPLEFINLAGDESYEPVKAHHKEYLDEIMEKRK